MTWAGPFGDDYVELDHGKTRAELLRQVRAWQMMFDTSVVGPVATIEGRRLHVKDASLDEPDDPETLRLDAADGPLWLTSVDQLSGSEKSSASHVRDAAAAAGSRPCDADRNRNAAVRFRHA